MGSLRYFANDYSGSGSGRQVVHGILFASVLASAPTHPRIAFQDRDGQPGYCPHTANGLNGVQNTMLGHGKEIIIIRS